MSDLDGDAMLDASTATDPESWFARMQEIGADSGWLKPVGASHRALYIDNSATLLVTFDNYEAARHRPKQLPVGTGLADECDWSQLCILSQGPSWYRDRAIHAYFDRLVDEGFFDDYDRVLFYGAGPSGHAAAAYSVCAPGARVLLLNPVATLLPEIAGWDSRHRKARRLDFTSRFGYAPDMVDGARQVTVIRDPASAPDAMHAALFHGPHVQHMTARHGGTDLETTFDRLGILNHLIAAGMDGRLTPGRFGTLWRRRRDDQSWLRSLQAAVAPHPSREAMLCRNVVSRLKLNRFRRRLAELTPG